MSWTTKTMEDKAGADLVMRVWDESGAGTGPFVLGHMAADGAGGGEQIATEAELSLLSARVGPIDGSITTEEYNTTNLTQNQLGRLLARELKNIDDRDQRAEDDDNPVIIGAEGNVFDVTLSLDTSAYASGEVLAATQEITSFFSANGGRAMLDSIVVLDEDDQGTAFDIVLFNANSTLGTENAAPSISDADARTIIGIGGPSATGEPANPLRINNGSYIDLGGCKVQTKMGVGLQLKAGAATTSVWIAAVLQTSGSGITPTHTVNGIRLKLANTWLD